VKDPLKTADDVAETESASHVTTTNDDEPQPGTDESIDAAKAQVVDNVTSECTSSTAGRQDGTAAGTEEGKGNDWNLPLWFIS